MEAYRAVHGADERYTMPASAKLHKRQAEVTLLVGDTEAAEIIF